MFKKNILRKKRALKSKSRTDSNSISRIGVFRSNQYLYVYLIDHVTKKTVCALSTKSKFLNLENSKINIASASALGAGFGKILIEKGYTKVHFDRSGYIYHGRIRALVENIRQSGVEI